MQLRAEIDARFRVPTGGGRATDPQWTERRLVALRTLKRLEALTAKVRRQEGINVEPMQLAALLLEKTTERLSEQELLRVVEEAAFVQLRDQARIVELFRRALSHLR